MKTHRKMMKNKFNGNVLLFIVAVLLKSSCGENIKQCPDYQIHFEKIIGFRPPTISSVSANYGAPFEEKILYKSYFQVPSVINLYCLEMCKNDYNCESYALNFNKSECYGFSSNERSLNTHNLRRLDDQELVEDISVVYFVKTCLNSEYYCVTYSFINRDSHRKKIYENFSSVTFC
jgi:hypothetical protein